MVNQMKDKMKILHLEIGRCIDCPYCNYVPKSDNFDFICKHPEIVKKNIIFDNKTIPKWCPLPNKDEEVVTCSVCNKECVPDTNCVGNWICPDELCEVHK